MHDSLIGPGGRLPDGVLLLLNRPLANALADVVNENISVALDDEPEDHEAPAMTSEHQEGVGTYVPAAELAAAVAQRDALTSENARLTAALEFYAEIRQYNGVAGHPDQTPPIVFERGARARNTLAAASGSQEGEGDA